MSKIILTSKKGTARVSGCEMFNIHNVVGHLGLSVIPHDMAFYRHLLPDRKLDYIIDGIYAMRGGLWDGKFFFKEQYYRFFPVALNTAYRLGNDVIKVLCRLSGQCECHCFVRQENAEWFCDLLEKALAIGVLRNSVREFPTGWPDAIAFIRNAKGPVVFSYSSTGDTFSNLGFDENVASLHPSLEITPEGFEDYFFRPDLDFIQVVNHWQTTLKD